MQNDIYKICIPTFQESFFKHKSHKYCLLIPLFNEGDRFLSQLNKMIKINIFSLVDVVICDAGSSDGTTVESFLNAQGFTALLVRKGKGRYSTDLRMGYYWALKQGYEGIITVDGNDKDDLSALHLFVEALEAKFDYVQGSRYINGGRAINTPFVRHWALKLINEPVMSLCARMRLTDTTNGFRAYSKRFLEDKRVLPFRNIFFGYELIYYLPIKAARLGFRVLEVPVTRSYPDNGDVPTKVGGIRGNIYQLSILWHIICGDYDPERGK